MRLTKKVNQYKFSALCLIAIIYLCFSNTSEISTPNYIFFIRFDLLVHFLMFFTLSFLFFLEKEREKKDRKKILKFIVNHKFIVFIFLIGLLIEIFQPILSNRSRELYDFLADVVGSYTGFFVFKLFFKWNQSIF